LNYMKIQNKLQTLFAVLLVGFSVNVALGDAPLVSNDNNEVKIKSVDATIPDSSFFLSELGLSSKDLNWGKAVKGLSIAAMLKPAKDPRDRSIGYTAVVVSVKNQSDSPLIIPLMNDFPLLSYFEAGVTPPKLLERYCIPLGGWGFNPGSLHLDSGKMVTFLSERHFDFNKEHLPMIITLGFDYNGRVNMSDSKTGLLLDSNEVKFP